MGASLGGPSPLLASSLPRIGIVGGGLAGLSCAWLLDGVAGAQFFARGPQPTDVRLLELLGLAVASIEAEMTITITETGRTSRFVSPSRARAWTVLPRWNRQSLWAFLVLSLAARRLTQNGDWLVAVEPWLARLPIAEEERENVLLPLLSAMIGCTIDETRGLSARGALTFIGKALPDRLLDPFRHANSRIGLGGNVERLAAASRAAPASEVFRRRFLHPLVTPDFIRSQRRLDAYQGRRNARFVGSNTHEVDSQESALLSAVRVARRLAPEGPNLLALEAQPGRGDFGPETR